MTTPFHSTKQANLTTPPAERVGPVSPTLSLISILFVPFFLSETDSPAF